MCAPRRMRPGVRVCVRARRRVCAREGGCDICATLWGGVVFMHPCCKNDTILGNVAYLSHFLWYIEVISVSLCNKNSNLEGKCYQKT